MAEKMIDKIKKIMHNPERIRNIGIAAHIDHGKCISKDARVYLADGRFIKAEELFKIASKEGVLFEENDEHIIYDLTKKDFFVFSLNKDTGKIEKKRIQLAWKLKGGEAIKVTLRNGFSITTTPEHKFIVFDGEFKEKNAFQLSLGDRIVCARKLEIDEIKNIKEEILKRLSKENFYVFFNERFGKYIKQVIMKKNIKSIVLEKDKSFYHGIWKNRYHIKDVLNIINKLGLDFNEVYDNIDYIIYRKGKKEGKSSKAVKLPKNLEEFYYLSGFFFGDGTSKKIVVGKKSIEEYLTKILKELGIKISYRKYKGKTPEIVTNMTLAKILECLFDYPLKNKARSIGIKEFLMRAPKKLVASFIKGYFDADGTVEKARSAITISSASKEMIDALHLLLLRLGCIAIKEKDNSLSLSGLSAINFMKNVGFNVKEKNLKAEALVKNASFSYACDKVKVGNQVMFIKKALQNFEDLAFIEVKKIEKSYEDIVYDFTVEDNHNFIAEGMVIHNTTFSDNLLLGAGMISEELAGKQLALDFHEDEQARGITIDAANVNMVHEYEKEEYLINLIDTPGHVDFGGDVTRAMRAVDGAIVVVCAVEGIMPQTETVLKQALRERVKPVLFINKVDRLIRELKLTPEKMQERFVKIIAGVNELIEKIAEPEYKEKWKVSVANGSVAFGSAFHNWALSLPFMQKTGITFKDIIEAYNEGEKYKELAKKAPLHIVILDMVVKHLPNPKEAQKYRIPRLWHGEIESKEGQALINCNPEGPLFFVPTKIVVDPQAGEIAAGRIFSGTMKKGMEVYLNRAKQKTRVQQVYIYKGARREVIDEVPAGNIIGIGGIKTFVGETISSYETEPFEEITHIFEPVVTKAIEATKPSDLPKLIEVLRIVAKEDPSIKVEINEETGQHLLHGMGELHLEIIENRIRKEKGVDVKTSPPIVVYKETVTKKSREIEGKSPNKHNKLYFIVEPLDENIYQAIKAKKIPEMRIKKKIPDVIAALEEAGMDGQEARKVIDVYKGNILVDGTRGIVHIGEIIEMVMDMFEDVMNQGPLAREPCIKLKVTLKDAILHEDAIHRGPSQIYPAVRDGIKGAIMDASPLLLEPIQVMQFEVPSQYLGEITKIVANKRGQILEMNQEEDIVVIRAKLPVAETFGLSNEIRSATQGRASWFLVDQMFEKLPDELQQKIRQQIIQRKGLTEAQLGA